MGQPGPDRFLIGAVQDVTEFVRDLGLEIGDRPVSEAAQAHLDPELFSLLMAAALAGLRPNHSVPLEAVGEDVAGHLAKAGLVELDDGMVTVGPQLHPFEAVLVLERAIEIIAAEPEESLDVGRTTGERFLFLGPRGHRVMVTESPTGCGPVRVTCLCTGDRDALLHRIAGAPDDPSADEAFAASASRWSADLAELGPLLAYEGDVPVRRCASPTDADGAPLLVTAERSSGDARMWLAWPDAAIEVDGLEDDGGRWIDVDDLFLRVVRFAGLGGDDRPSTAAPPQEPAEAGRIGCRLIMGGAMSGGDVTWVADPSGGMWWIDPDDSVEPVASSGLDLAATVLRYLPRTETSALAP